MSTRWERIARETVGDDYATTYAERFRSMAARGDDIHGEATFVSGLLPPPARILDAGCGTGRVAVRLAELGYDVVGVDVDASMLDVARAEAPDLDWRLGDLSSFDLRRSSSTSCWSRATPSRCSSPARCSTRASDWATT